jgi:hypothetical protein
MVRHPTRRDALALGAGLARSLVARRAVPGLALGEIVRDAGAARGATGVPRFRRGINTWPWFDLTREYPAPRKDYAWPPFQDQRATPTAADLRRLAAAGFDFIRLPVDPGPMLAADANHRALLLSSVLDAVREARDAGLGVILNLQPNEATHYWNSWTLIASTRAPEFSAYRALVAEVAGALVTLDMPRLALEPVNEPPPACGASTWVATQGALLGTARQAAARLPLVATGSCGSMVAGLVALDPTPLERFAPLLYTFHFYEPYLFSHQGAPWMREPVYRALNDVPWPGSAGTREDTLAAVRAAMAKDHERSPDAKREAIAITERLMAQYFDANPDSRFLDRYLDAAAGWADAHAIARDRVVMGEFGATKTTWRFAAARDADRARYIHDVRVAAEARGFGWSFWNLFDSMGLMDDDTHAIDTDVLRALGLRVPD